MLLPTMSLRLAKTVILVGPLAIIIIPAPLHRGGQINVVKSWKGWREHVLLSLTELGFLLPLVWVATPLAAFADCPLRRAPFIAGILCLALGLWLHDRSHADLGSNWSITLRRVRRSCFPTG